MSCIIPFLFRLQLLQRIQEDRFDILLFSTSQCLGSFGAAFAPTYGITLEELQTGKAPLFMVEINVRIDLNHWYGLSISFI